MIYLTFYIRFENYVAKSNYHQFLLSKIKGKATDLKVGFVSRTFL